MTATAPAQKPPGLLSGELRAQLAERHLNDFIRFAWPVIEPKNPYLSNWHIETICEHLEAVTRRQITRLIINIPPRSMKSNAVSVMWPVWTWIRRPEERFLFASYSNDLSIKHSVDRRAIIASDWYQREWKSSFQLSDDQNQKQEFMNDRRGVMIATSVGGTATGKGGGILVADDLLNPREATSEATRASANLFFDRTFSNRLNDPKRDAIVIVMQRLHEDDVTGHALSTGKWEHLVLPMEYDGRKCVTCLGSVEQRTEIGQLLHQARFGQAEVASYKRQMGGYAYAGQYQQIPAPDEGAIWKRKWWQYYDTDPLQMHFDEVIQSWDCIFRRSSGSDFVVGTTWGRIGADKYLLDLDRGRYDFVETCNAIRKMSAKWPRATAKLIEDKANGPAIIRTLQHEISGIIAVNPEGGKESRAAAVAPQIEAGNVFLPQNAPWKDAFVEEAAIFPNGANDDQVDSASQALLRLGASMAVALVPEFSRAVHVQKQARPTWFARWISLSWGPESCAHWFAADSKGVARLYRELTIEDCSVADLAAQVAHLTSPDLATLKSIPVYVSPDYFDRQATGQSIARQIAFGFESALGADASFIWELSDDERAMEMAQAVLSLEARRKKAATGTRMDVKAARGDEPAAWERLRDLLSPQKLPDVPVVWDRELAMAMTDDASPEKAAEYRRYLKAVEGNTAALPIRFFIDPDCPVTIDALLAGVRDPKHPGYSADGPYRAVLQSLALGLLAHQEQKSQEPMGAYIERKIADVRTDDPMARVMAARKAEAEFKQKNSMQPITFRRASVRPKR